MVMPIKRFAAWMRLKEQLHNTPHRVSIQEGQIWWAAVGENIGVEINGKHEQFSRPVLIFKKLSEAGFMGIPLTSQPHEGSWYVKFELHGRQQYAALSQARIMSTSRLYGNKCYGSVTRKDFQNISNRFAELYSHKKYDSDQ